MPSNKPENSENLSVNSETQSFRRPPERWQGAWENYCPCNRVTSPVLMFSLSLFPLKCFFLAPLSTALRTQSASISWGRVFPRKTRAWRRWSYKIWDANISDSVLIFCMNPFNQFHCFKVVLLVTCGKIVGSPASSRWSMIWGRAFQFTSPVKLNMVCFRLVACVRVYLSPPHKPNAAARFWSGTIGWKMCELFWLGIGKLPNAVQW